MNTENEPGSDNSPGPIPAATPAKVIYKDNPHWRGPRFQLRFFWYAPLFFLIAYMMLHFFFPGAVDQATAAVYNKYNELVAQVSQLLSPHPVTAATTASAPTQPFTLQEIKNGVQDHLLQFGMIDKGASLDWKQIEYTDPTDLTYSLYAHMAQGSTEYCMGTVALNLQQHTMVVTSKLQGW